MNLNELTLGQIRELQNSNELTLGQIRELQNFSNPPSLLKVTTHPFKIGENYLFRTVTMIITGKLQSVYDSELVVTDACWIADTGRFSDSLITCEFNEVEPFPSGEVIIGRNSLIDAVSIKKLPKERK